jgi:hypothetical protein
MSSMVHDASDLRMALNIVAPLLILTQLLKGNLLASKTAGIFIRLLS